ncbi:MAG TPA: ABC transporter substrate-binding protein, partial [Candidatus Binataceae bacterium]|nr:ABC transporter substrate-binding protein [Candidatus Binataceae bacterium]
MFRSSGNLAHLLLTVALMPGLAACARPAKPAGFIQVDIDTSPTSTDPRYATDAISSRIDELVFDSLVKVDRNLNFVGDLAESIERPSATTVTFHLRRGIRFSDGAELTSRDVKFTYDSILAPDSQSAKRGGLRELAAVDAPDPFTVTMTTRDPYAPALELAMEAIVPADTPRPARATGAAPPGS